MLRYAHNMAYEERKMISQSFAVTTNVEPLSYTIPDDTLGEYLYYCNT